MVVWSTIEASCPICKNRLRLREVGSGFALGQDSDLFVRMKGKHIIQAEIHTCPQCRYSGLAGDFLRDISTEARLLFLRDVAPGLVDEDEDRAEDRAPRKLTAGKNAARKSTGRKGTRAKTDRGAGESITEETLEESCSHSRSPAPSSSEVDPSEADSPDAGGSAGASSRSRQPSRPGMDDAKRGLKKSKKSLARRRRTEESRFSGPIPLHPCKRTPLAHIQYYWAAKTGEALGYSSHALGEHLLRAYWCLRIAPSSKLPASDLKRLRKRYLTEAIRRFRQGLRHQKNPNILYLVAELCRRNSNFLLSTRYFQRFFEKGAEACEYLLRAAEKLCRVAEGKLSTELSMEEVLYDPAPETDEE